MNFTARFIFLCSAVAFLLALEACKSEPVRPEKNVAVKKSHELPKQEESSTLKIKVRSVLGETDYRRKDSDLWRKLRYGQNVMEKDRIRTALESEAILGALDGSAIWIKENSDVFIDAEFMKSSEKNINVTIANGKIYFDVQKQPAGKKILFKTGLMTASIRGTSGFVGVVDGMSVASLKEGVVDVANSNGKEETIVDEQTIIVDENGFSKKLKLKSSGTETLAKAMESIAKTPSKKKGKASKMGSLETSLKRFDAKYAKRRAKFNKSLRFSAQPLTDTLFEPSVTLTARVNPGVIVMVLGESDTVGADSMYKHTFEWNADSYGLKRFIATCKSGDVETTCYTWKSVYAPKEKPAVSRDSSQAVETSVESASSNNVGAVAVKIEGPRNEQIHWFFKNGAYSTNLKFSLDGVDASSLKQVRSISVKRKGKVVREFKNDELTSLAYEVPITVALNKIANFEVEVLLDNGKKYTARKTYEVYCNPRNHPGGKARNFIKKSREEYADAKSRGMLRGE